MNIENQIHIRPRFTKPVLVSFETVKERVNTKKQELRDLYTINQSEQHIWLSLAKNKRKWYSPHLHIELRENEEGNKEAKGLFGPEPGLWTFFMFIHFVVAGLFIVFAMFAYSNWMLKENNFVFVMGMIAMIFCWIGLYIFARILRRKAAPESQKLLDILETIIE